MTTKAMLKKQCKIQAYDTYETLGLNFSSTPYKDKAPKFMHKIDRLLTVDPGHPYDVNHLSMISTLYKLLIQDIHILYTIKPRGPYLVNN